MKIYRPNPDLAAHLRDLERLSTDELLDLLSRSRSNGNKTYSRRVEFELRRRKAPK